MEILRGSKKPEIARVLLKKKKKVEKYTDAPIPTGKFSMFYKVWRSVLKTF